MIERIFELLTAKKMSPSQFADEIGVQRSGISHLISGRNKPSLEFVLKVLNRFPDVSAEWLLLGKDTTAKSLSPVVSSDIPDKLPLFDENIGFEKPMDQKVIKKRKTEDSEKEVEKLIYLYKDRTFKEYKPE